MLGGDSNHGGSMEVSARRGKVEVRPRRRALGGNVEVSPHSKALGGNVEVSPHNMGELITPYNESFAAVICGRAQRGGAGLFVESGLHLKKQIVEAFAAKNANDRAGNFRVKEFSLTFTNATQKKAGISGKRQEVVYFFWKGSWASKLPNL